MQNNSPTVLILILLLVQYFTAASQPSNGGSATSDILTKTVYSLSAFKNISYRYEEELSYASEKYHNTLSGNVYLDFSSTDSFIGFKYQIESDVLKQIFNGTERFDLNKIEKTIEINSQPAAGSFRSMSFFYNSIVTLRNALPVIAKDSNLSKTIADTLIGGDWFYTISFSFAGKGIDPYFGFPDTARLSRAIHYKIIIDRKTYLPQTVIQTNNVNDDFIKTSFRKISTTSLPPSELSWYYSTYANEYHQATKKENPVLIKAGSDAPDWKLPVYNKNENVVLSRRKGKMILLDFWIKNCGPCIESMPHLNELQKKFGSTEFEIIGINSYDQKEDVAWFCNKHRPAYTVLMNGQHVAEAYGVGGFPTVVLINKEGRVLYSSPGFDRSRIEELIRDNLQAH